MSIIVGLLSALIATLVYYPAVYKLAISILPKIQGWEKLAKLLANIAALIGSVGCLYFFTHTLGILFSNLEKNENVMFERALQALLLPAIILSFFWVVLKLLQLFLAQRPKPMSDDIYLMLVKEAQGLNKKDALWARCLVENKGDQDKTTASYIKRRIDEIKRLEFNSRNRNSEKINNEPPSIFDSTFKIRLTVLTILCLSTAFASYSNWDNFESQKITPQSITSDGSTGKKLWNLFSCEYCEDKQCSPAPEYKQIVINFGLADGHFRKNFTHQNGGVADVRTPLWEGCLYQQKSSGAITNIAACKTSGKYEKWDKFSRSRQPAKFDHYRNFDGKTYYHLESFEYLNNYRSLGSSSLSCKAELAN